MQSLDSAYTLLIVPPHFDAYIAIGIPGLAVFVAALWVWQAFQIDRKFGALLATVVLSVIGLAGLADRLSWFHSLGDLPPRFVLFAAPLLLAVVVLSTSRVGTMLSKRMSVSTLIALQIFRLPLELVMLRAALVQIMPIEFSMLGYNFDVLTGLGALILLGYRALIGELSLFVVKAWNLFGIACLLVIAGLATATSPQVHAFGTAPVHLNTWILFFPYSLLPLLLVSFAVLGHLILSRKLYAKAAHRPTPTFALTLNK